MRRRYRRKSLLLCGLSLSGLLAALLPSLARAAEPTAPMRLGRAGQVEVAGREVRCENVQTRLDRQLPNLGAAAPEARLMLLNPRLLSRYSGTVQLFVFHHECGHTRVGASELAADCWAVTQGVRDGWLDRNGLAQVCRSFGNAPESDTHPSGRSRCANVDRCYAAAEIEVASKRQGEQRRAQAASLRDAPKLVAGPKLVRTSVLR